MKVTCVNEPSEEAMQAFMHVVYLMAQRQARDLVKNSTSEEVLVKLKHHTPDDAA